MIIREVSPDGVGAELGLEPGDQITEWNGVSATDILDYLYYDSAERFTVTVVRDGVSHVLDVEKDEEETLGLTFEDPGLAARRCANRCVFCFVDQLPKGMRETLSVKDDDYRHSFLYGNYVTLSNLTAFDRERILRYRLSPLYVSVHTTDGELRKKMLRNRFAGDILDKIADFVRAGIELHTQIVMVPGWNDGEELERTLRDLAGFAPGVRSVAIVPLGMTAFREGLCPLSPVTKEIAAETLDRVQSFRARALREGKPLSVWCSDEFYVRAGREIPEAEHYGGFAQIEDGVGILAKFRQDVAFELETAGRADEYLPADVISGVSGFEFLCGIADRVNEKFPGLVHPHCIENDWFGRSITVTGLLTGRDIERQLKGRMKTDRLILPGTLFRDRKDLFLDDRTAEDLGKALGATVIVAGDGEFLGTFRKSAKIAGRRGT